MSPSNDNAVFSVEFAAHELGVATTTLRNWLRDGRVVPRLRLNGRRPVFTPDELAALKRDDAA